jgi:CheY-like chemotaxis protein
MSQRVLVFDSDAAFAAGVRQNFERMGLAVDVANDGPSGLELAGAHRPSLILLSIELPGMNGFLVCKKIKKMAELEHVPLVIMSSEVDQETFEQHKKLRTRANEYIRKPIEFPALMNVIKRYVQTPTPTAAAHVSSASSASNALNASGANGSNGYKNGASNGHSAHANGSARSAPLPVNAGVSEAEAAALDIEEAFSMSDDEVIILPDQDDHQADYHADSYEDERDAADSAAMQTVVTPLPLAMLAGELGELDGQLQQVKVASDVGSVRANGRSALAEPPALPGAAELAASVAAFVASTPPTQPLGGVIARDRERDLLRESREREPRSSARSVSSLSGVSRPPQPPLESAAQAAAHAAEVDRLKREITAAEERAQSAERRAQFAEQRAASAEKSLDTAKRSGGASCRELLDLREQLNRKDRELLEMREQVTARDKQLVEANDRGLAVERQLQDVRDGYSELQRELEKKLELINGLTSDKETSRKRLDDTRARAERAETKVKELSAALDELRTLHQQELEELAQAHAQSSQALRAEHAAVLEQKQKQHAGELEAWAAKSAADATERARLHAAELSSLKEQHTSQQSELQRALDESRQAAVELEQAHRSALVALREELGNAHREQLAQTQQQLSAAHRSELDELDVRMQKLNAELTEQQGMVATLSEQLSGTRTRLQHTEQAHAELDAELQSLAADRDQLSYQNSEISAQLSVAESRIQRDSVLLNRLRQAMSQGLGLFDEEQSPRN